MKKESLIPPDLSRCQSETTNWNFMTLGPKVYYRCQTKPRWIATERRIPFGSMSLCDECKQVCMKQMARRVVYNLIVRPRRIKP